MDEGECHQFEGSIGYVPAKNRENLYLFYWGEGVLLSLNIVGSLLGQMTHLVKTVVSRNQAMTSIQGSLSSIQGKLESLRLHNASLTQNLVDCTSYTLKAVSQSFENDFQQVEQFHRPLVVSREQIQANQILKDGEIVSLWM